MAKKRPTREAIRQLSFARLQDSRNEHKKKIGDERDARFNAYIKSLKAPKEIPGLMRSALNAEGHAKQLRLLAEGDSWFEYPLPWPDGDGVIVQLEELLGYSIANMAHHGDEARQMLALDQRSEIIKRLSDDRVRFDALLFSGGGNDMLGNQMSLWFKHYMPQITPLEALFNEQAFGAILGIVEAAYREVIAIRDRFSPQTIIFFHGYDFPPVTGIGVCNTGPWLRPALDNLFKSIGFSVPDPNQQFILVKMMLQRFQAMLKSIAADPNISKVVIVETQGTLVANRDDWQNEIHPSTQGFVRIADRFRKALLSTFP